MTEPLFGFAAPERALPFQAPRAAPVATPAPALVAAPMRSRARRIVRPWIIVALAVMVVLDAALLVLVMRGLS
jgi:hypothetical protein